MRTVWYRVVYGDSISANKSHLDPLSSTFNLKVEAGSHTQMRQIYVYNLRGVMEIYRRRPPLQDQRLHRLYRSQPSSLLRAPIPYHTPASVRHRHTFATHFDAL